MEYFSHNKVRNYTQKMFFVTRVCPWSTVTDLYLCDIINIEIIHKQLVIVSFILVPFHVGKVDNFDYNPQDIKDQMVKLRLKQTGKKNAKTYRVVAAHSQDKRDGKVLENLGFYNPIPQKSIINLNVESMDKWIANGAQMTERVAKLYKLVKDNKVEL